MDKQKIQEQIIPDYNCCYKYPIKLGISSIYRLWVAIAYEGTILIFKRDTNFNGQICHYDKDGTMLSSIEIPKKYQIKMQGIIYKQQQIQMILVQTIFQPSFRTEFYLLKWNFKAQNKQLMKLTSIQRGIVRGEENFFYCYDGIYCNVVLDIYYINMKRIVKNITINYFKNSENREEPLTSFFMNVENDELFKKYCISKFNIKSSSSPSYSILSICNFTNEIRRGQNIEFKLFILKQEQVSYYTLQIPAEQLENIKGQEFNVVFQIEEQRLKITFFDQSICLTYFYQINHQLIYENHYISKSPKPIKKLNFKARQYLLQFKDNSVKNLKITPFLFSYGENVIKKDNFYYYVYTGRPKTMSQFVVNTFVGHDQIIISVKTPYQEYKKVITYFLESIIENCNENLVYSVLQLLLQKEQTWRE